MFSAQPATFAQTEEKPKAYLFDEFKSTNVKEVKTRTQKLKKKLEDTIQNQNISIIYLVFFYDQKKASSRSTERLVRDTLFENCRDCFGIDPPRMSFVNFGNSEEQKIQFWIIPIGAETPEFLTLNTNK